MKFIKDSFTEPDNVTYDITPVLAFIGVVGIIGLAAFSLPLDGVGLGIAAVISAKGVTHRLQHGKKKQIEP